MRTIINNPNHLTNDCIDTTTNKVRAIIINENDEVILTNYADIYMLPGGKVDNYEGNITALKRETLEELGIDINLNQITPLIKIENYLSNYPVRNTTTSINKLVRTTYYVVKYNGPINTQKRSLTQSEKSGNFSINKIKFKDIKSLVLNHHSSNPRYPFFQQELLQVLEEYQKNNALKVNNSFGQALASAGDDRIEFYEEQRHKKNTEFRKNNPLIDLHTHSCFSDGDLTPNELIKRARNNGVSTISITDHDTLLGNQNIFRGYAPELEGMKIIPGIELSAKTNIGRMHILGYGIDIHNSSLNKKMTELKNHSINSVLSIIEQIKKDYGIIFTYDELKELINSNHNLGRPDVAKLCVQNGYADNIQDAFDKYLIDAQTKTKAYAKGILYEECIELILKSGGIPVLAHPITLKRNDLELLKLIRQMITCGLQGLEVYHSDHSPEETNKYLKIANKLDLLISGGTDYHGATVKPDIEIGTGKNNNILIKQLSILNRL